MSGPLAERVAIGTGAGRGLGRARALEPACRGATVIVNDVGTGSDGGGNADRSPAEDVGAEIRAAGGIRVNAVAPAARTRLTEHLIPETVDTFGPERVSPLAAWLAGPAAAHVTGRAFDIGGPTLSLAEGRRRGPAAERADGWAHEDVDAVVAELPADAAPSPRGDGTMGDDA